MPQREKKWSLKFAIPEKSDIDQRQKKTQIQHDREQEKRETHYPAEIK